MGINSCREREASLAVKTPVLHLDLFSSFRSRQLLKRILHIQGSVDYVETETLAKDYLYGA